MVAIVRVSTLRGSNIDDALDKLGPLVLVYSVLFVVWAWNQPWDQWRVTDALKWFSRNAYGIYLCHVLVLSLAGDLCYQLSARTYGPIYGVSLFAAAAAGSAMLSMWSAAIFKRVFSPSAG